MTGVIVSGLLLVAVWVWSRWVRRGQARIPGANAWTSWERAESRARETPSRTRQ